jgi:hypothetical protein
MSESIFSVGFFSHVFHGRLWDTRKKNQTKPRPKVSGIHYEGAGVASIVGVRVIENTRSNKDCRGVYTAVVSVKRDGLVGRRHTSFFPAEWTRQEVLDAIREVYEQKPKDNRTWGWSGYSSEGVKILMLLDKEQKIVTAWPKRSYRRAALRRQDARRRQKNDELYREMLQARWQGACDMAGAVGDRVVTH